MASSSDQGISDLILLWLKLELVDPAGSNTNVWLRGLTGLTEI
jgi:hypothetical protein